MPILANVSPSDILPSGDPDILVFIGIMVAGFVIGAGGHVYKSTPVIVLGIVLILAATMVLPLLVLRDGG